MLWRAYSWLRGTVALQVAVGMLTLVAAAWVAADLGLTLTAYVLQAIGAVSILVAVVIFREEIRRALGRASPLRWWRARSESPPGDASVYLPLAEALQALARDRIGALVVIPRRDPLDELLTGGTPIEGITSPQLLEALFHVGSPVHDGAAVVDGLRIRLAGAVLPLSVSTDLPDSHGTRHRAALGLTEKCDAIALAVSEERGQISLAVGGTITTVPAAPVALARRIEEIVRQAPTRAVTQRPTRDRRGGRRRREAVRDMIVRVVILAAVIVAWNTVAGERGSVIVKTVPVELSDVPAGLDFDPPQPNEVELVLRGPRRVLLALTPADLHATLDLSGEQTPGRKDLVVRAAAPSGVEVIRVKPPAVTVDVLVRRTLPVRVRSKSRTAQVVPDTVEVLGSEAAFRGVTELRTRPVEPPIGGRVAAAELVLPEGLRLVDDRHRQVSVVFD